jgi:hypothetical protein
MQAIYRFEAIPQEIADSVRTTLRSPQYGHPAHVETAAGYGPCRLCLRTFREGEDRRILFTYNPFGEPKALPQPGPVFVHQHQCERFEGLMLPEEILALPLFVEGFDTETWNVRRKPVESGSIEQALSRLFTVPSIRYAHVRNAEAGCSSHGSHGSSRRLRI